jgi:hypothetical protein
MVIEKLQDFLNIKTLKIIYKHKTTKANHNGTPFFCSNSQTKGNGKQL